MIYRKLQSCFYPEKIWGVYLKQRHNWGNRAFWKQLFWFPLSSSQGPLNCIIKRFEISFFISKNNLSSRISQTGLRVTGLSITWGLTFRVLKIPITPPDSEVWGQTSAILQSTTGTPLNFENHLVDCSLTYIHVWKSNLLYQENVKHMSSRKSVTQLFNLARSISYLNKT